MHPRGNEALQRVKLHHIPVLSHGHPELSVRGHQAHWSCCPSAPKGCLSPSSSSFPPRPELLLLCQHFLSSREQPWSRSGARAAGCGSHPRQAAPPKP